MIVVPTTSLCQLFNLISVHRWSKDTSLQQQIDKLRHYTNIANLEWKIEIKVKFEWE